VSECVCVCVFVCVYVYMYTCIHRLEPLKAGRLTPAAGMWDTVVCMQAHTHIHACGHVGYCGMYACMCVCVDTVVCMHVCVGLCVCV
jgi:hypothetical protein